MIEIQQLIIKGKVNGEFDTSDNEIIKLIDDKIEDYISRYKFALSKEQKDFLIEECTESVLKKIELESRL
tara:strand:- start:30 stop:239 length:210 start_codon:yes stop_codon:yes gene_type:complete